jgi:hypothetical protein
MRRIEGVSRVGSRRRLRRDDKEIVGSWQLAVGSWQLTVDGGIERV